MGSYIERNMGVCSAIESDWETAGKYWKRAIELFPTNSTAHYLEGCYYKVSEKYEPALWSMQKSIALDPDFRPAYIGVSDCHLLQSNFDLSLTASWACLARFPDAVGAHFNISQAIYQTLRKKGSGSPDDPDKCATARKALELVKDRASEHWVKGDANMLRFFMEAANIRHNLPVQAVHVWKVYGWRP